MSLNLDKSGWKRVAFGDVVRNVNESVRDPQAVGITRVVAMEHLDPGELRIQRWSSTDEGTTFTRRVKPRQTLFGKRRAYQRKVAYAEFEAICSGDIYTFEADATQLLSELLPFLVQSDGFFDHAVGTSAGSLSPRTSWRDLADFEFDIPPLDEQKRIADLLWAVEAHRRAVLELRAAGRACLWRLVRHRLASIASMIRLCEVATTRSGPSFDASDLHDRAVEGSIPVIGIPNTKSDGTIDLADVGHVTGLPDSVGRVDDRSLILIRTNGSRERIGNVYLPPAEAHGHAVSAFQFLMQANDSRDRDYLFWVLNDRAMQDRMSDSASGSVGLGNLAVRWLNAQEVPWPAEGDDRRALVEEFRRFEAAGVAVGSQLASLEVLRGAISTAIFGGV